MSRLDAERIARLYDGFYAEHDREPVQASPDRVSPLEAVAGFVVVAIVIFIFGWVL
jgi:hypothetical protein